MTVKKKKADAELKVGAAEYGLDLKEFEEEVEELREMHRSRAQIDAAVVAAQAAVNYADCLRERRDGARNRGSAS